ncbi:MAG: hypothetical protein ACYCUV_09425 [Phycisphaerae bacterium]
MNNNADSQRRITQVTMASDVPEMGIVDERSRKRYTVRRAKKSGGLVMNAADGSVNRPQREK